MKKFRNPIILNNPKGNTSDPYVIRYGGYYYHCYSNKDGVYITESHTLWDIGKGNTVQVYNCNAPDALQSWYAPELHCIDNKWYIYAAPDYGNDHHVMSVLEREGDSPMGEYKFRGKVQGLQDEWSIDGTVLTYQKEQYFIWTCCREMYMSKMADPCTVTGKKIVIAKPEFAFETRENLVNEGPAVLYKGNKIHVVYSANDSRCDDYCLGLLTFEAGGDIMDINNWLKTPYAVFERHADILGPGHCSFTTVTEDGSEVDYIVYHANFESGSGWNGRNVFIQPFGWDENDVPIFGKPQL